MGIQVLHWFNQSQSYCNGDSQCVCYVPQKSCLCNVNNSRIHCIMLPATVHVAELYAFILAHTTVALWLTLLSMI